jgi:sphingosine-1-phosphate phosphatase 1
MLLLPLADSSDMFLLSNPYAPIITTFVTIVVVLFYPASDRWSPAREDSTAILGGWFGLQLGCWGTYQTGYLHGAPIPPPYPIIWPTFGSYGLILLRMVIGGVIMIATRAVFKPISYFIVCKIFGADRKLLKSQPNRIENKTKIKVNLAYKLVTYTAIGFNMVVTAPIVFRVIGCERPTYYTEL